MDATEVGLIRPGLRERKKQQTRETIARVALRLFAERGYEHTTLADIADAADVSKRTIFAYFDSKEDILFCDEPIFYERLRQKLEQRPDGSTTVDALREFVSSLESHDEDSKLRKKIISTEDSLRLGERARFARIGDLVAESIAKDLDAEPGDLRPSLVAASMLAAFRTVRDRVEAESEQPLSHEQAMAIIDEVLEFLRGGLEALRDSAKTTRPTRRRARSAAR
jgi:AcrR family transcriptional regulator